ncbi:MAG: ABC transporter permease [Firmicutes bacterium]|nr:ABC transporter permease [Bacillota bacterium]
MKLWYSFIKEVKLASRGFYFYIELFMALLLLLILMFVVPKNFESRQSEYIHLDLPKTVKKAYIKEIKDKDLDGKVEKVEIKNDDKVINSRLYKTEDKEIYIIDDKKDVIKLADKKQKIGAVIKLDNKNNLDYEYYLQGYESKRLKNLILIIHNVGTDTIKTVFDKQDVRPLSTEYEALTDRENLIPSFLTFNGSLMGLFIIAAYIFLDKQEGVIKAYAVTASTVREYLLSKVGVLLLTTIVSSFIIVVPVMGLKPNYLLLLVFLFATGFFASSLGLLVASFYKNIMQAFGTIYLIMIAMIIPNIAYFIPSWNPTLIKILPTYPMLEGFKEIIKESGDVSYILTVSLVFFIVGLILFEIANKRYKKTLTV